MFPRRPPGSIFSALSRPGKKGEEGKRVTGKGSGAARANTERVVLPNPYRTVIQEVRFLASPLLLLLLLSRTTHNRPPLPLPLPLLISLFPIPSSPCPFPYRDRSPVTIRRPWPLQSVYICGHFSAQVFTIVDTKDFLLTPPSRTDRRSAHQSRCGMHLALVKTSRRVRSRRISHDEAENLDR